MLLRPVVGLVVEVGVGVEVGVVGVSTVVVVPWVLPPEEPPEVLLELLDEEPVEAALPAVVAVLLVLKPGDVLLVPKSQAFNRSDETERSAKAILLNLIDAHSFRHQ
jgi:hypothetical protein